MFAVIIYSFLACIISVSILRPIALKFQIVDTPDSRKQHKGNIPLVGGLAIYITILSSVLIFLEHTSFIIDFLIAISVVVLIGLLDDKFELSAKIRFFIQFLIALFLAYKTDIQLEYFGNLIGFGDLYLGAFSGPVAIFSMIVGMNAFNMMDGIDGLAASMCLVCLTAIALITSDARLEIIAGTSGMALAVFLLFNLGLCGSKYKIFLGDAGSMMLGLIVAWFLITASQTEIPDFKPVTALWLIAIPLIDMTSVMFKRLLKGESMLKADREHLHHKLIDAGFNAKYVLIMITFFAIMLIAVGLVFDKSDMPESLSFYVFIVFMITYNLAHSKFSKRDEEPK